MFRAFRDSQATHWTTIYFQLRRILWTIIIYSLLMDILPSHPRILLSRILIHHITPLRTISCSIHLPSHLLLTHRALTTLLVIPFPLPHPTSLIYPLLSSLNFFEYCILALIDLDQKFKTFRGFGEAGVARRQRSRATSREVPTRRGAAVVGNSARS